MGEALTAATPAVRRWIFALLLAAGLLAEFVAFDRATSRNHAWVYPRWNDQIQYLTEVYTGYEHLREVGVVQGLWGALVNPSAQGTLHDFAAITVFLFAGPSRSAALSVNMLAFIAWQVALFLAVFRRTRSPALAILAAALPLALSGPWRVQPGSALDFRLDHLAVCAFGLLSAGAIMADGFRSRSGAMIFGIGAAMVLLTRFLTGTYLVLVFAGLAFWLSTQPGRRQCWSNLALAALLAALLAAPLLWINRDWVWNYYVIGHFTGPESALRAPGLGLLESVRFVFGKWTQWHAGAAFAVAAVVCGAAVALARVRPRTDQPGNRDWLVLGAVFFIAPAVVLTLHAQKSEVVLGILGPGAVLFLLGLVRWSQPTPRVLAGVATIGVAVAGGSFLQALRSGANDPAFVQEARKVNTLADALFDSARRAGLNRPSIATDEITDYLDAQILRVICYERQRRWVQFEMRLPTGIAAEADDVIVSRLRESDFIFLTRAGSRGSWPYDDQMRRLHSRLVSICEEEFHLAGPQELFGRTVALYCRQGIVFPRH